MNEVRITINELLREMDIGNEYIENNINQFIEEVKSNIEKRAEFLKKRSKGNWEYLRTRDTYYLDLCRLCAELKVCRYYFKN